MNSKKEYIVQLEKTLQAIKRYKKKKLKASGLGITADQWELVKQIDLDPGISQKSLAEATLKDPASVKRSLDLLQNRAIIERRLVATDLRERALHLTESGEDLIHRMLPIAIDIRAKGVSGITQNEMEELSAILRKVHQNFNS
ncbi:hypothetical protein JYT74_00170 [Crocinitomix catalasitica]|nr:hypothetical protein [Crocinitomix catalasitica]